MFRPVKVIDIELSRPLNDVENLEGYGALKALVRWQGSPVGYANVPITAGCCRATALRQAILDQLGSNLFQRKLYLEMAESFFLEEARRDSGLDTPPDDSRDLPLITVAVCTRNRVSDLPLCLNALMALDYARLDLLLIDNAPDDDSAERLLKTNFRDVRYIREPRPGLDWARNRAITEARGEIIAFTDDDVIVDPGWVAALARVFVESPEVMAVTGLVVPFELETEAQILFERFYGFGKGFVRKRYHIDRGRSRKEKFHVRAGRFGTGANMSFRRSLFEKIGNFDPALDVGTVTNGGGDLEMFFRVIQEGYTLIYEPSAIVRHRHRREYADLHAHMRNWGIGTYSYLVRSALSYPSMRLEIVRFGLKWLWKGNLRRLVKNLLRPSGIPYDLICAQLLGSLFGLFRYQKAGSIAAKIARNFEPPAKAHLAVTHMPLKPVTEATRTQAIASFISVHSSLPSKTTDI
ncbi:MAG: glycosyltransferase family 2 protein [bacterium]